MFISVSFSILLSAVLGDPIQISRKDSPLSGWDRSQRSMVYTIARYMARLDDMNGTDSSDKINNMLNSLGSGSRGTGLLKRQVRIPLLNKNNELFTAPVTLSTGQQFMLDLDTGSSDTWVRGPNCQSKDGSCQGPAVDLTSDQLVPSKNGFLTSYGSGAVQGGVAVAALKIGDNQATLPIGVSALEKGFGVGQSDGLMGLAFDSISNIAKSTGTNSNFMDSLAAKGLPNLIAFHFSTDVRDQGEVTFGAIDPAKFVGQPTTIKLNSQSFWQFDQSQVQFQVGNTRGNLAGAFPNAIADTGTTLMLIDAEPAAAINKAIGATDAGGGMAVFNSCQEGLQGPPIQMLIGGTTFQIPANVYVVNDKGKCFSGIAGMPSSAAQGGMPAILGDTFLKAVYTAYDKDNNQLIMAQSINVR